MQGTGEAVMWGPFVGRALDSLPESTIGSVLQMSDGCTLEARKADGVAASLLALRNGSGHVQWTRVIEARIKQTDNSMTNLPIYSVELKRSYRDASGHKVRFKCEWREGREGGYFYLNPDLSFREFKVSW